MPDDLTRTSAPSSDGGQPTATFGAPDGTASYPRPRGPAPAGLLPEVPGYELLEPVGHGGMGAVYRARQVATNRTVALKVILAGELATPAARERFKAEAEATAKLSHPHIVQLYEAGEAGGRAYLVCEYVPGGTLAALLDGTPWPAGRAAGLLLPLARAVAHAHAAGVVHRDLKPSNVLLAADGTPKVADFGIAKRLDADSHTRTESILGTPSYMPPEQAGGAKAVGPAADVYTLGAVFYELLTGRPPFKGADVVETLDQVRTREPVSPRTLQPRLPRDAETVCLKCLQKDPAKRYPSADALADDLDRFLTGRPILARPVGSVERAWRWCRRNPAVAGLLAALAAVIAAGVVGVFGQWARAERNAAEQKLARDDAEAAHKATEEAYRQTAAALADARAQRKLADLREARLEFAQAQALCEDGEVGRGLGHFVRAVELAEGGEDAELARVARVGLAAWAADLPPPRSAFPHLHQPKFVAFTPDGKRMVASGRESTVYLWDLGTGVKVRTYRVPPLQARGFNLLFTFWTVAVSPDGRTVAAGGSEGQIWVWDIDKPDPVAVIGATPTTDDDLWSVAFAPDGRLWAVDGTGGARLWDLAARKPVVTLEKVTTAVVHAVAVSPDGARVYTGDRSGHLREWDAATGAHRRNWHHGGWVTDVAVAPDGREVAAVGTEGGCRVIDLTTWQVVREVDLAGAYGAGVAFAPDGETFVVADQDGTARTWHLRTGQPVGAPFRFAGIIDRPRFRPGSRDLAVPAGDAVLVCRAPEPPGRLLNPGNPHRVWGLDFAPDGDRVAVATGGSLSTYDPRTGGEALAVATEPDSLVVRFDPARPRVVRGTRRTLGVVDLPDGRRTEADAGVGRLNRVAFAPGGAALFGSGADTLYRWDGPSLRRTAATTGARLGVPPGVSFAALAVRPDGGELLVSHGPRVLFLDPGTLAPLAGRPGWDAPDGVTDARYTPDGRRVFAGLRNNSAVLLDATTGAPAPLRMTHNRAVTAVAVDPAGRVLLTGSRDGTARFWDAATGLPLGPPLRHAGPVELVAYSPAGDRVATGTATGHALTWKIPPPPLPGTVAEVRAKVREWTGGASETKP